MSSYFGFGRAIISGGHVDGQPGGSLRINIEGLLRKESRRLYGSILLILGSGVRPEISLYNLNSSHIYPISLVRTSYSQLHRQPGKGADPTSRLSAALVCNDYLVIIQLRSLSTRAWDKHLFKHFRPMILTSEATQGEMERLRFDPGFVQRVQLLLHFLTSPNDVG